jgi:hypothetical protein
MKRWWQLIWEAIASVVKYSNPWCRGALHAPCLGEQQFAPTIQIFNRRSNNCFKSPLSPIRSSGFL